MRGLLLAPVFAACLAGADTRLEPPVLGYMFDPQAGAVRAIQGIPGASRLSDAVDTGGRQFAKAWIAPGKQYMIAAGVDSKAYLVDLRGNGTLGLSDDALDHVVWSSGGSAAVLVYAGNRIRVLKISGDVPETPFAANPAAGTSILAVSDDAQIVLAVQKTDASTDLMAIESGSERRLLSAPGLNAAAFLHGTHDAVVSDAVEAKIYLLRDAAELSIAGRQDEPSALAIAADNSRVFVASKTRRTVSTIRLSDGSASSADCSCQPEVLNALQGEVFRVTSAIDAPVWLFKPDAVVAPFTFVPALAVSLE